MLHWNPWMDNLLKFFTRWNLENAWPSKKEARWWFQIFFMSIPIWGRFPFWLIFFRWVETTNQEGDPFLEGAMGFSGHPGLVSGLIPRPGDIKSQREFLVRKGAEKTSKEGWNRLKPAKTNRFMEVGWGGYLFEKVVFFLEDSDPETNDILYCFFFACRVCLSSNQTSSKPPSDHWLFLFEFSTCWIVGFL